MPAEKRPTSTEPRPDGEPPQTWREPAVYDVFEADGVYLGAVRLPPRTAIHWFGREYLWGISGGEMDENYVVRLRLNTR